MKKIILFVIAFQSLFVFSQKIESTASEKAVVYFTRANATGALINFTFFDGDKTIGRFNGPKYLRYECNAGEHLFWARSENKSFVEATLEPGKTYIIDVIPKMGAIKASVKLVPVDKKNYKLKRIQKLISKRDTELFEESELNELQNEMSEIILRGLEKYKSLKEKGKKIAKLYPEMTVDKNDLIYVKN
jgi:hypothetical protein